MNVSIEKALKLCCGYALTPRCIGRIEALADKCSDGSLSPEEREEYEMLVNVGFFISILQAKARLLLASGRAD